MLYPLTFQPVLKERVWGGHALQRLYGKPVPPGKTIGESWELCDRPEAAGVIDQGALAGKDLRWAMQYHAAELLGSAPAIHGRFPWLVKLLDADQTLSVQVHPPEAIAARLGGEAKTELWYVAEARDGAAVFAGVKPGVTRETFAEALDRGQIASTNCRRIRAMSFSCPADGCTLWEQAS
jgi:mannose-6-phosphate isomerase